MAIIKMYGFAAPQKKFLKEKLNYNNMSGVVTKEEIIAALYKISEDFVKACHSADDESFFAERQGKWSIAQDVRHLITSINAARLAYLLPKFILRLYTGKPNRPSRSYDELVAKYISKLQQGGRASGVFIPKNISPKTSKEKQLHRFAKSVKRFASSLQKNKEALLDKYLAPHPLLGKITLRELGFFTVYHIQHHLEIIQRKKIYAQV
jgi:hypothetical protein